MPKRERLEPRQQFLFTASWRGEIEGWVVNYINANLWKVTPHHDFDDLYQDAYFYYLTCVERYHVDQAAHFFALFRTCFFNHVTYLANVRSDRREVSATLTGEDGEEIDLVDYAAASNESSLAVAVNYEELEDIEVPEEVKELLEGCDRYRRPRTFRRLQGLRETTNSFLCRVAGFDPDGGVDVRTQLEGYLGRLAGPDTV